MAGGSVLSTTLQALCRHADDEGFFRSCWRGGAAAISPPVLPLHGDYASGAGTAFDKAKPAPSGLAGEMRAFGSRGKRAGVRQMRRGCGTSRAASVGHGVRLPPSSSPPDRRHA